MEPKIYLQNAQEPATRPYPEPDKFNPYHRNSCIYDLF